MNGNATANKGKIHLSTSWPLHRLRQRRGRRIGVGVLLPPAYRVFTVSDFGVTVRKVPLRVGWPSSRPGLLRRGLFPGRFVIQESEEPGSVCLLFERRANSHACLHSVMDGKSSFSKVPNSHTVRDRLDGHTGTQSRLPWTPVPCRLDRSTCLQVAPSELGRQFMF